MDIIEDLDEDCDAKVTFEETGETGESILTFSLEDGETQIRVYPEGIKKLQNLLNFIDGSGLINE